MVQKKQDDMNYKKLVCMALLAGEIMLASGAETYRVEDTIMHILKVAGLGKSEAIVSGMGIFVTLADENIATTISSNKRVTSRSTNLGKVYEVNTISRQFCAGQISLADAHEQLKQIKNKRVYGELEHFLGNIGTVMFFAVLLGGSTYDCIFATINGLIIALCLFGLGKIHMNAFFTSLLCAFAVAISSGFYQKYLNAPIALDVVISGSILPLVPGVAITNAIRDTLQGDYMSGGVRAMEAFVMATAISIGIGIGLTIYK